MKIIRVEYDYAGISTNSEARELIDFAGVLKKEVIEWLKKKHPELV